MESVWVRRYPLLVAGCTWLLVVAGGLVTSNDAALSIPDWPLNWGRLIPPLEANIRYEFAHRALALVVALMVGGLAWKLRTRLAWAALGTVLAQAALGGMLVKFLDPAQAAIAHAALAQVCFGLTVAVACGADLLVRDGRTGRSAPLTAAMAALLTQTILGAAVRHGVSGPIPHIAGAVVATILVMWAGLSTLMENSEDAAPRRAAMALLSLTFAQVFLGIAAYTVRAATADAPQPMPAMVWITVAHVAVGALAFGASVVLNAQVSRPALRMVTA